MLAEVVNYPAVDITQATIPLGNKGHRFIHAATGELNTVSQAAPSMSAAVALRGPLGAGGSAFQLCPPPATHEQHTPFERSRSRPESHTRRTAPQNMDCVPSHAQTISAERCRETLGPRTFALLREAMLQQQDTFADQLWELHRLARVQGRKSMLASTEEALGLQKDAPHAPSGIFDRKQQAQLRTRTLESIVNLPTLPSSLRRSKASKAAQAAVPDLLGGAPVPSARGQPVVQDTSYGSTKSPNSGPYSAAPNSAPRQGVPASVSKQLSAGPVGLPNVAGPNFAGGSLEALCSLHNVSDPRGVQSGNNAAPNNTMSPAPNPSAQPGTSGSEALLPGASVDLHSQWFQRNCAQSSALHSNLQDVLNVPIPGLPTDPKVAASSYTAPSNSLWSGQSFMPGAMFGMPAASGGFPNIGSASMLGGASGVASGLDASMLGKWPNVNAGMANLMGAMPTHSAGGLWGSQAAIPGPLQRPHLGLGSQPPPSFGPRSDAPAPPAGAAEANRELTKVAGKVGADGKVSSTDKSAADILLSMRGK